MEAAKPGVSFFGRTRLVNVLVALILLAGFGVRMIDLTDLPLDFHPTRQLFSAIKARAMYYELSPNLPIPEWQRQIGIKLGQEEPPFEPVVMETLVAGTYLVFGEHLWIARIYSSLFWLLGGLALFALARRMSDVNGGIIALLYFVFLTFAVIASRSFQPDPLMVALIACSFWAFYRWKDTRTWKWTILAGVITGAAIFVKTWAAFPLLGAYAAAILFGGDLKKSLRDPQTWVLAILSSLPVAIYLILGYLVMGFLTSQADFRFFPALWATGSFYVRWLNMADSVVGSGALLLGLLGIFLAQSKDRPFLIGMWLGYIAYGFTLPYHITSHSYYQLPLIAIVALSLAFPASVLFEKIVAFSSTSSMVRIATAALILFAVGHAIWDARTTLLGRDFRGDAAFWAMLGDKLGHTSSVITLTNDYGLSLAYWGFQDSTYWLRAGDINLRDLAGKNVQPIMRFDSSINGKQYFLITLPEAYQSDDQLRKDLSHYPIFAQGDGYLIFDLQHPLKTP